MSEEFLPPVRFGGAEKNIHDGDSVIFFNLPGRQHPPDRLGVHRKRFLINFRARQFKDLAIATMTHYKDSFDDAGGLPRIP